MELKDVLAISGKPGLYKYISQGRSGIIVESLLDGKRMNAHSTMKVSALEDIAIFTEDEEVPLARVLRSIREKENGGQTISHKSSSAELTAFFLEILPEYDSERVYTSDIKKVVNWYNLLQEKELLHIVDEKEEKDQASDDVAENADNNEKQETKQQ